MFTGLLITRDDRGSRTQLTPIDPAVLSEGGVVTACGLAGRMDFPATVAPFILRGVTLAGIDSVTAHPVPAPLAPGGNQRHLRHSLARLCKPTQGKTTPACNPFTADRSPPAVHQPLFNQDSP